MLLRDEVLHVAKSYIGTKEVGYNRGATVDKFNKIAGVPRGSSWCMAFVYSCFAEASDNVRIANPLSRTGSVARQLKFAKDAGSGLVVISLQDIGAQLSLQKGDVLCHKTGRQAPSDIGFLWLGHTGIFAASHKGGIGTIEGNTSAGIRGSQREGNGVYYRTRPTTYWLAAISLREK